MIITICRRCTLTIESDQLAQSHPSTLLELVQFDSTVPPCSLDDALEETDHAGRDTESRAQGDGLILATAGSG